MKKIKKFINDNIISIIFGILFLSTAGVYAASIAASNTTYSYSKTSQTTVKGALDELINKVNNDPFKNSTLSSKYKAVGYSYSSNLDENGNQGCGTYSTNLSTKDVVRIPGATKLHVKLKYGTEYNHDILYVVAGEYDGPLYETQPIVGLVNKYSGGTNSPITVEFDVNSDTVTFGFKTDGSTGYYGYYAIVTNASSVDTMSQYIAKLNKLEVKESTSGSNLTLTPSFSPNVTSYYVTSSYWQYNGDLYVKATPITGATTSYSAGSWTPRGENPIKVVVTSSNGEKTNTYNINVTGASGSSS